MGGTVDQFVETEKCRVVNPREHCAARGIALRNPVQPPEYKPNPNRCTVSLSPPLSLYTHSITDSSHHPLGRSLTYRHCLLATQPMLLV